MSLFIFLPVAFFFLYTNTETKVSKMALFKVPLVMTNLFFFPSMKGSFFVFFFP